MPNFSPKKVVKNKVWTLTRKVVGVETYHGIHPNIMAQWKAPKDTTPRWAPYSYYSIMGWMLRDFEQKKGAPKDSQ